jgi:16S rRNA (cytidine1402-2'-O)-methyltransferase
MECYRKRNVASIADALLLAMFALSRARLLWQHRALPRHTPPAGIQESAMSGTLFIVATPIGNLGDISQRALQVLSSVTLIACEDTRHSARLLQACGITTPTQAVHEFNERQRVEGLLDRVAAGADIALISDAGTPLVSDPGFQLVRRAQQRGLKVVPVPGACAVIAALSVAGLPSDRFCFEGFLPARPQARRAALERLAREPRTLVFYEAPHRIVECLEDLVQLFGGERQATLARELTKTHEIIRQAALAELLEFVQGDANQQKGEIVLLVAGHVAAAELDEAALRTLGILLEELPLKQAAALAARLTGLPKGQLYDAGLQLQGKKD